MKRFLTAICLILVALFLVAPSSYAGYADVVAVVDESGSMSTEHAWLGGMITSLDNALVGNTPSFAPNQYGLIGFGASTPAPRQINVGGNQFGTAAEFSTATANLLLSGGTEDGWAGINFAFGYNYGEGAAKNLILVTDEDRDNWDTTLSYANILADLTAGNFLLNAVVNATFKDAAGAVALGIDALGYAYVADGSGGYVRTEGGYVFSDYVTTDSDYITLALATGGAAWDLNQLRSGGLTADSFTEAFVDIKVKEIQQQVPEPATLLLLGLGFLGLGVLRRR